MLVLTAIVSITDLCHSAGSAWLACTAIGWLKAPYLATAYFFIVSAILVHILIVLMSILSQSTDMLPRLRTGMEMN